jgi:hypothetical protein
MCRDRQLREVDAIEPLRSRGEQGDPDEVISGIETVDALGRL